MSTYIYVFMIHLIFSFIPFFFDISRLCSLWNFPNCCKSPRFSQYIYWKKYAYTWTHEVQTHVVQGSTVFIIFYIPKMRFLEKILFIYLFLERGERREKERERNVGERRKHWSVASYMRPNRGLSLRSRQGPWPGIKPVTFGFAGWCPSSWATPVRA